MTALHLAASSPPAGGAAIDQVIIATAGAMIATTALLVLGIGYLTGRVGLLGWAANHGRRQIARGQSPRSLEATVAH